MNTHTAHSGHSAAKLQGPTAVRRERSGGEGGAATCTLCRHRRAQACVPRHQGAHWPGKGLGRRRSWGVTPPGPPAVGGTSLAPSVLTEAGPEQRPPFPWVSRALCSRSELPPNGDLGPCGRRTDVHCVVFLGLDQLKYLLTTSCAPSPALGQQTQTGIPKVLILGSSQAPAPTEASSRHHEHPRGLRLQAHRTTKV